MTLHTRVAVGQPATTEHARLAFRALRLALGAGDSVPFTDEPKGNGQAEIGHPPGVGLAAWLWVDYGTDGPLPRHVCDKWCPKAGDEYGSGPEDEAAHDLEVAGDPILNGWAVFEVNFDTTYGYQGPNGESCSDLHAQLVTGLGKVLDHFELPWQWYDEYAGEWHQPDDGHLARFGDAHRSTGADAWFRGPVTELIKRMGG